MECSISTAVREEYEKFARELNYPDGFVSRNGKRLHFALDDNRHRAVYVKVKLTPGRKKTTNDTADGQPSTM
jgi:hypothetical protein